MWCVCVCGVCVCVCVCVCVFCVTSYIRKLDFPPLPQALGGLVSDMQSAVASFSSGQGEQIASFTAKFGT